MPLPLVGNLLNFPEINEMPQKINRLADENGGVVTLWLPDPQVYITDYGMMKELFVTKG